MTTLYFEASDEDDLRKTGFSKDGKHANPQILIGLLVGLGGYAIGYDIFEGNTYEGHTLIPFLESIEAHICIAFTAYTIYKELERVLKEEKASISLQTASEITHNMYNITYQLPESKQIISTLLNMDEQQRKLYEIVQKNF